MFKRFFLSVAMLAAIAAANAQNSYSKAIGVRISPTSNYDVIAASLKTFLTEAGAIELNAGVGVTGTPGGYYPGTHRTTSASISGAYQHHFDIKPLAGLKWYVGGGATISNTFSDYKDIKGVSAGIFPTGGADYKFKNMPLNVSADYRPTFMIAKPNVGWHNFIGDQFGISARYTF